MVFSELKLTPIQVDITTENVSANAGFLIPWERIEFSTAEGLEKELKLEMNIGHLLFGEKVRAIAKRIDCDDVLFELTNNAKFAVVHLTWKMAKEENPVFPVTEVFDNWAEVYQNRIVRDNLDYLNEEF